MALSAGEYYSGGVVRDSQGRTVVISETAGAALSAGEQYSGGYLRDADGRTVICQDTLNAALGAGEAYSGGDVRDSQGRVAVAVDTVNSALSGSEQISGGQVRDSLGRRVIAVDTLGAGLSAGEQFSGGNVLDKAGRTVIALEGGGGGTYDTAIAADTPTYWWKFGEPSGTTAADSADANTGTYQPTVTLAQAGLPHSSGGGVLFNGTTGWVTTTTSIVFVAATVFSIECWFKTTAAALGMLIGANGSKTITTNNQLDRNLYLDATGHVNFAAGSTPLTSAGTYNDGNYHHAVGTCAGGSPGTSVVYVDGAQVGTGPQTPFAYTGFWRLGEQFFAAAATFFSGTITQAAVYNYVLTPTQVLAHYNAR